MRQNIKGWQDARRRRGDQWLVPSLASTESKGDKAIFHELLSPLSSAMAAEKVGMIQ